MKRNQLITMCSLLSLASLSFAVPVEMPSAEVLNKRLREKGFTHFAEKTTIVKDLEGQNLEAFGVAITIETSLYDYNESLKSSMQPALAQVLQVQMQMNKPMLFEALLKDSPEALKELEGFGLYKPLK